MTKSRLARTAHFKQLGIDVWVRRRPRAAQTAAKPAETRRGAQGPTSAASPAQRRPRSDAAPASRSTPAPAAVPPRSPVKPAESFRIRCFRFGKVFVAIAEDAWPRRRYLLDVARSLNRFQAAERQDVIFDWPQPGAGPGGGERAFQAFFRHQTRAGVRAVLSGGRILALLGHADADRSHAVGGHLYVSPEAPDADAKRALWQLVRELEAQP